MNTRSIVTALLTTSLVLGGGVAMADPHGWNGPHSWDGPRGWDRDGGHEYREAHYGWARVVGVEPLRTQLRVTVPRQECYRETRWEGGRGERRVGEIDRTGATILGGLLGAVVGHQIGDGDGQRVATVAGALIGAGVAHEAVERQAPREDGDRYDRARYDHDGYEHDGYDHEGYGAPRPLTVERCGTRYEERWEDRITGYRVTYEYDGRIGVTDMPSAPGEHIRVQVNIRPDRDG